MTATLATRELETRHHELRKTRMQMVDGHLTGNLRTVQQGLSARAYVDGYWGFASAPLEGAGQRERVQHEAVSNARAMARFGPRRALAMATEPYRGAHVFAGRAPLTATECNERLAALHAHCLQHFPGLRATRLLIGDEHHTKQLRTEAGGDSLASIQRAFCGIVLGAEDETGAPIEVDLLRSCKGSLADLDWSLETLAPLLARAHEHLQAKRHAVIMPNTGEAIGGLGEVGLSANSGAIANAYARATGIKPRKFPLNAQPAYTPVAPGQIAVPVFLS